MPRRVRVEVEGGLYHVYNSKGAWHRFAEQSCSIAFPGWGVGTRGVRSRDCGGVCPAFCSSAVWVARLRPEGYAVAIFRDGVSKEPGGAERDRTVDLLNAIRTL